MLRGTQLTVDSTVSRRSDQKQRGTVTGCRERHPKSSFFTQDQTISSDRSNAFLFSSSGGRWKPVRADLWIHHDLCGLPSYFAFSGAENLRAVWRVSSMIKPLSPPHKKQNKTKHLSCCSVASCFHGTGVGNIYSWGKCWQPEPVPLLQPGIGQAKEAVWAAPAPGIEILPGESCDLRLDSDICVISIFIRPLTIKSLPKPYQGLEMCGMQSNYHRRPRRNTYV